VSLVELVRAGAPAAIVESIDDATLAGVIAGWLDAARAAWPAIAVDEAVFVAHVAARIPATARPDGLDAIHAADLWLTAACAAGDPAAIAAFDERLIAPLDRVLGQAGLAGDQIDEVKQELRRKLLVAEDGRARIADYSGRADLRTWMRTAAVRAGIDLVRRHRDVSLDDEDLAALPLIGDDPELAHLKGRYRDDLRTAVIDAMTALEARVRALLKLHHVDGLGIDRIGALYGVHRATAARWLASAREALADRVQRALIDRLGVTRSELRSIARLVESQLDVSVRRLLT
jgi:RNA polymerase sigma-70 factor (ECF subfamily)